MIFSFEMILGSFFPGVGQIPYIKREFCFTSNYAPKKLELLSLAFKLQQTLPNFRVLSQKFSIQEQRIGKNRRESFVEWENHDLFLLEKEKTRY